MMSENSKDIQDAVRERMDARGFKLGDADSHRLIVNTIVWETLAVLGEWGLVELDHENAPVRRAERGGD